MKRLFLFAGLLFAIGLLGLFSYRVRELIAALVMFGVGFGVFFLIAVVYVLADGAAKAAKEVAIRLRIRVPQWNRAGRDWALGFAHSVQERHLWQRWTHRIPAPVVPFHDAE